MYWVSTLYLSSNASMSRHYRTPPDTIVLHAVGPDTIVLHAVGPDTIVLHAVGPDTIVLHAAGPDTIVLHAVGDIQRDKPLRVIHCLRLRVPHLELARPSLICHSHSHRYQDD